MDLGVMRGTLFSQGGLELGHMSSQLILLLLVGLRAPVAAWAKFQCRALGTQAIPTLSTPNLAAVAMLPTMSKKVVRFNPQSLRKYRATDCTVDNSSLSVASVGRLLPEGLGASTKSALGRCIPAKRRETKSGRCVVTEFFRGHTLRPIYP